MKGLFSEDLPENCPPREAQIVQNKMQVYRLVRNNPPTMEDFRSQSYMHPLRETARECRNRAISVWTKQRDCEKIRKLSFHKDKNEMVCKITLKENAGYIEMRNSDSHVDWWPFKNYPILDYCELSFNHE